MHIHVRAYDRVHLTNVLHNQVKMPTEIIDNKPHIDRYIYYKALIHNE